MNDATTTETTTTKGDTMNTTEIAEGINGSGNTVWIVCTVRQEATGRQNHWMEYFDTKAEAENWVKWAI